MNFRDAHHGLTAGDDAKASGMAQVDAGVDPEWTKAADHALRTVAKRMRYFTSEDVTAVLDAQHMVTPESRAMGSIFRRAAKAMICRKTQSFPETKLATRPEHHRGLVQIWESLTCPAHADA
jgi:hypothetical protein